MRNMSQHARITVNELKTMLIRDMLGTKLDPKDRDLDKDCGYPTDVTSEMYWQMYERHDYAARVVEAYSSESWSTPPAVIESEGKKTTRWETGWQGLLDDPDLDVLGSLEQLDVESGIVSFGAMLLGFDDTADLSQPVPGFDRLGKPDPTSRKDGVRLLYTLPTSERHVRVSEIEGNPRSSRFGLPLTYTFTLQGAQAGEDGQGLPIKSGQTQTEKTEVHWTRVLHASDTGRTYAPPRMKNVFNRLLDVRKTLGASAEMFWQGAFPGFVFSVFPELAGMADLDKESVKEEVRNYRNNLDGRYMAADGGTFDTLDSQVVDPTNTVMQHLQSICSTKQIPMRIFLGTESGHLASTQDTRVWNRRLQSRRTKHINKHLLLPFCYRLAYAGVLPMPSKPLKAVWTDLDTLSEVEQADVGLKRTQALMQYVTGKVFLVMDFETYLTHVLDYTPARARAVAAENKDLLTLLKKMVMKKEDPLAGADQDSGPAGGGRVGNAGSPAGRPGGKRP